MANDPCTHTNVCGLTTWRPAADQKPYCVLHFPDPARKDAALFEKTLKTYLQANKSDLRYVVWPEQYEAPSLSNQRFSSDVNLEGIVLGRGIVNFDGATFERDPIVKVKTLRGINLSNATFEGNLVIAVDTGECAITLDRVPAVRGSTRIDTPSSHVRLGNSHSLGPVEITNASFDNGLTLRGNVSTDKSLAIDGASGLFDWQKCIFPGLRPCTADKEKKRRKPSYIYSGDQSDLDVARRLSTIIGCPVCSSSAYIENHSDWRLA